MKTTISAAAAVAALLLPLLAAAQQTVWRCGPEGHSYSDTPCTNGRALALADTRPADDVHAALVSARSERRLADSLLHERLQRETAARGNGLGGFNTAAEAAKPVKPSAAVSARHKPRQHRLAATGTWQAVASASRRTPD